MSSKINLLKHAIGPKIVLKKTVPKSSNVPETGKHCCSKVFFVLIFFLHVVPVVCIGSYDFMTIFRKSHKILIKLSK